MNPHPTVAFRILCTAMLAALFVACTPLPAMTPTPAQINLTPYDNSIQAWLTLGDKSKLLSDEPVLGFTPGRPVSGATITVNATTLYQQFAGAGAAMTDSSAWLIMKNLDEAARQSLMRNLFTREGSGIGISYLRLPMGASDFALKDYSYDDLVSGQTDPGLEDFSIAYDKEYIIPALKLAAHLNPQLGLMGSPWSPPAWMKKNSQFHGSSLLPEFFADFAQYHVKFVQAYATEGLKIDAITPQNEPLYATEGYPTMYMSAKDQQAFVRDYLGPAFKAAGLDTKIIIFDHNWDLADYPLAVLADAAAANYVDGVAFHCYGGDVSAQSKVHDAYPQKGIWFTECSGGDWAPNFGDNLNWNMKNLVIGNFRNWGKSVLLWNLALDQEAGPQNGGCGDCRGVVTIDTRSGKITYNEEYYALGHLTKFVDPGAYRVFSTGGSGVPQNVAFLNPDGSLVLIVQSDSAVDFNVAWNGKFFPYHLPAGGIATFKWSAGVQAAATVTPAAAVLPTPRPTLNAGSIPAEGTLLDFEDNPNIFDSQNAQASLANIAHSGQAALKSQSPSGEWHIVGADFAQPLNLAGFEKLCFWVNDTTSGDDGSASNTIGVNLIDSGGRDEEIWTDNPGAGDNPHTVRNQWVQMCLDLSVYSQVDLTSIASIEFETYWAGTAYFDDVSVAGRAP
jgi:glucosylceramidase